MVMMKTQSENWSARGASFDDSSFGLCRHLLWRVDMEGDLLGAILKNPSVAGDEVDDPTVRILRRVAREAGYGGFVLANIVPIVATEPRKMVEIVQQNPETLDEWRRVIRKRNECIDQIRRTCPRILVAWGRMETCRLRDMADGVLRLLSRPYYKGEIVTLGRNRDGSPHHPLRCKLDGLKPWMSTY